MKYQTAYCLRSFVLALSVEAHDNDLCCAIVQRPDFDEEWECHLFSKDGIWSTEQHLSILATSIVLLSPLLTTYHGKYDGGRLKGEKIYDTIVIW